MNLYSASNSDWTVDSAVARCAGRTAYSTTDLLHACVGLTTHLINGRIGVDLDDEKVFAPVAIEDYLSSLGHLSDNVRSNIRSILYRMSDVLLGRNQDKDEIRVGRELIAAALRIETRPDFD
jgi:hypothetical protein